MKEFLKKIADGLNKHWVIKTIILFLPSVYMPVFVKYVGKEWNLLDSEDNLTFWGIVITLIVYIGVLSVNILSSYKAKRDKELDKIREKEHNDKIKKYKNEIKEYENTIGVQVMLMSGIGKICEVKLEAITAYINSSIETGVFNKPFNETVFPENQLKNIAKEMKLCLSQITEVAFDQISVSMAYDFPQLNSELRWIDQQEIAQCMQLRHLKTNSSTAFYKIYSGKKNFIFLNDKKKAASENEYVFDQKDQKYHCIGSLICDEISIEGENDKIARMILTVSTYGHKFTDSEDSVVLENISHIIEEIILPQFEKRIRIELALLFVKKQYNKLKES